MFHVELNQIAWNRTIKQLAAINRNTIQKQLRLTARLVVEEAMGITPPIPRGGFGKGNAGIKIRTAVGQKSVALDVRKTMMPVEDVFVVRNKAKENRAGKYLRRYLKAGRTNSASKIFRDLGMGYFGEVHQNAQRFMHEEQRQEGRVKRGQAKRFYILNRGSIGTYIKERQKQVWKGVSGWNKAAAALKVRGKYWSAKAKAHSQPGLYRQSPPNDDDCWQEFANKSAYMQGPGREIMQRSFQGVQNRMTKDLETKLTMAHAKATPVV